VSTPNPFRYPPPAPCRKHAPSGYADYRSYRPWLRDEFMFRCAYCLQRETWVRRFGQFDIDHFQPQILRPDITVSYENLVYSCHGCNLVKGVNTLEVPSSVSLRVDRDGVISSLNDHGERIIDVLCLDDPENTRYRRMIIGIIRSLSRTEEGRETFLLMMGFPTDDLPDLSRLTCDNSRPQGVADSWRAKQERGELPLFYE